MRWNGFRQAEHQEGSPYGTNSLITDVLMDFLMRRNRSRRLLDNYITANRIGHSRHVPGAVYMFSADVSILSVSHLHSFQQLLQGAPWAIAARSICSSSALHRPSQRNASAGGGASGMPRDNASYGGTVLPALPQRMLSSRFPYIYHMAGSLPERVPDAASCPLRGSLPDNQKGQGAFCEHFPSPS